MVRFKKKNVLYKTYVFTSLILHFAELYCLGYNRLLFLCVLYIKLMCKFSDEDLQPLICVLY